MSEPSATGLLANDADSDAAAFGETLTATKITDPSHGTLTAFGTTGSFTYVPTAGYVGTDSFTYKINDGIEDGDSVATVTIAVRQPAVQIVETGVGYATIQNAIDAASTGQTVELQPGTYHERIDFKGKAIAVRGTDPTSASVVAATVLDGTGLGGTVVTFKGGETAEAVLAGVSVKFGQTFAIPGGAGILCNGASPTIRNNVVYGNAAFSGGMGNGFGGGICCANGASPTIKNNTISGNTGTYGGGISCHSASMTVQDNTISGNHGTYGPGICVSEATATIQNNAISSNIGSFGGGIWCYLASATVQNNTLYHNSASTGYGGGMYCESGSIASSNNIIASSTAGGGIYQYTDGRVTSAYSNVYGNTGGDYLGMTSPTGSDGNISLDPLFADPASNDLHLKSTGGHYKSGGWVRDAVTSPCVDAGDPAAAFPNEPLPNGGRLNMGFEGNTAQASRQSNRMPSPPSQLTIAPADPVCTSSLVATAGGSTDPDTGDTVSYRYQWSQLTSSVSARKGTGTSKAVNWGHDSIDGTLSGVTLHRGEVWQVHACATDGGLDSAWTDPVEITIGNSTPTSPTQLAIAPPAPVVSSRLVATAGGSADPDTADTVSYKYQWAQATGSGSAHKRAAIRKGLVWGHDSTDGALTGITLHKGDVWQVRACATDRTFDSAWTDPTEVTIGNAPPPAPASVTVTPISPTVSSQLQAAAISGGLDPDGDPVTYSYE
ncbi:MAG: right-handed parallel beta-helix repeat-containing protein, partial [Armatimonadota bacterium]